MAGLTNSNTNRRHQSEDYHIDEGEEEFGSSRDEFETHAEGDDEFVCCDGVEEVQDV